MGCANLDERQRGWIFQPSDRSWWRGEEAGAGMQDLGFSVLTVDYRGFGESTKRLPSEAMAYEHARAAWDWLSRQYPDIFGLSLGDAIAIELAAQVQDETGTLVKGSFTSIPDVVSSYRWGWLPVWPLITQRFEAVQRVTVTGAPLLVVHGSEGRTIAPELGRRLFEATTGPKRFELVQHNTNVVDRPQYRLTLAELFGLKLPPAPPSHPGRRHDAPEMQLGRRWS